MVSLTTLASLEPQARRADLKGCAGAAHAVEAGEAAALEDAQEFVAGVDADGRIAGFFTLVLDEGPAHVDSSVLGVPGSLLADADAILAVAPPGPAARGELRAEAFEDDRVQNQGAARFEGFGKIQQRSLVLVVAEVADAGPEAEDGVELFVGIEIPKIVLSKDDLETLSFGRCLRCGEDLRIEVDADDAVSATS